MPFHMTSVVQLRGMCKESSVFVDRVSTAEGQTPLCSLAVLNIHDPDIEAKPVLKRMRFK